MYAPLFGSSLYRVTGTQRDSLKRTSLPTRVLFPHSLSWYTWRTTERPFTVCPVPRFELFLCRLPHRIPPSWSVVLVIIFVSSPLPGISPDSFSSILWVAPYPRLRSNFALSCPTRSRPAPLNPLLHPLDPQSLAKAPFRPPTDRSGVFWYPSSRLRFFPCRSTPSTASPPSSVAALLAFMVPLCRSPCLLTICVRTLPLDHPPFFRSSQQFHCEVIMLCPFQASCITDWFLPVVWPPRCPFGTIGQRVLFFHGSWSGPFYVLTLQR